MKTIYFIAGILVLFGALNWGLVGMFGIDLVVKFLGAGTLATKVIYDLIGISALLAIFGHVKK